MYNSNFYCEISNEIQFHSHSPTQILVQGHLTQILGIWMCLFTNFKPTLLSQKHTSSDVGYLTSISLSHISSNVLKLALYNTAHPLSAPTRTLNGSLRWKLGVLPLHHQIKMNTKPTSITKTSISKSFFSPNLQPLIRKFGQRCMRRVSGSCYQTRKLGHSKNPKAPHTIGRDR